MDIATATKFTNEARHTIAVEASRRASRVSKMTNEDLLALADTLDSIGSHRVAKAAREVAGYPR